MKYDNVVMIAFMAVLVFLGISLLIGTSKSCDVHIDYDVTVSSKTNATDASLAEMKVGCFKLCAEQLRQQSTMMRDCFDKCDGLE